MSRIFISYRRVDSEGYVGRLYDALQRYFKPEDVFMDIDNIRPGQDFMKVVENAVNQCDVVLVIIGPQWLTVTDEDGQRRLDDENDFVYLEVATALNCDKLVIPVLVQQAKMPRTAELPKGLAALSRRNAIELTHKGFQHDVGVLVNVVQEAISAKAIRSEPTSPEAQRKLGELKKVRDAVINFTTSPLYSYRVDNNYFPVLGEGNPDARIMLIGEAPGKNEAERGRPFYGPSGEILNEMLRHIKLKREDVYLTNILKDRCPDNREPSKEDLEAYAPFMMQEIEIVQPEVLVTLGRFSMNYLLSYYNLPEKGQVISKIHGKLMQVQASYGQIYLVPMFHPAMALYTASKKDVIRQDFEKLRLFI